MQTNWNDGQKGLKVLITIQKALKFSVNLKVFLFLEGMGKNELRPI